MRLLWTIVWSIALFPAATARGAVPAPPADMPTDTRTLGNAFVEAWLGWRADLDTLSHGGVHPALLDAWMDAMPTWLVRDAARLALEPSVRSAAIRRATGGKDAARERTPAEEAMRQRFPFHHLALERRDPAGVRLRTRGGEYDAWLDLVSRAVRRGARSSREAIGVFEEEKRALPDGDESEVSRREISALIEFWKKVDESVSATPDRPEWPVSFERASTALVTRPTRDLTPAGALFARVCAEIALLAWTGAALGHERFAGQDANLDALSPGADRALDGSLATAWAGVAGQAIAIEATRPVTALWVAASCPDGGGSGFAEARVAGEGGSWTVVAVLDPRTRYFQRVDLGSRRAGRMRMEIARATGAEPVCVAEIRSGE